MDISEGYNSHCLAQTVTNPPSSRSSPKSAPLGLELDTKIDITNPFPAPVVSCESYAKDIHSKLVVVMVGLPARGKTFIAQKLWMYLSWIGLRVRTFNNGKYRRKLFSDETVGTTSQDFFDPENKDNVRSRMKIAQLALEDLAKFLCDTGDVGIIDATNSTWARREMIRDFISERSKKTGMKLRMLYIESICTDENLIEKNILSTKLSNPDYEQVDPETAINDFRERIRKYEAAYMTVSDLEGPYIKIINSGEHVEGHSVQGYIEGRLMYFLMQLNLSRKTIFMTRHGESEYNRGGKVGGDSPLTPEGRDYAKAMARWFDLQPDYSRIIISVKGFTNVSGIYIQQPTLISTKPFFKNDSKDMVMWYNCSIQRWLITRLKIVGTHDVSKFLENGQIYALLDEANVVSPEKGKEHTWKVWDVKAEEMKHFRGLEIIKEGGCKLWCSTLRRTIETCSFFKIEAVKWRALSELEVGTCDGLTYQEIKTRYPDQYEERRLNKLHFRYPSGESYKDVIQRLEPVIFELERSRLPVIVVGHRAVLRCLYGYFMGEPINDIPHLEFPLHEVVKLCPGPYGTAQQRYSFGYIKELASPTWLETPDWQKSPRMLPEGYYEARKIGELPPTKSKDTFDKTKLKSETGPELSQPSTS